DAENLETELERLGDSLLVVGDPSALKVHVHTDDPDAALALGNAAGTVEGVEIADMHRQTEEREERLSADPHARSATVAVTASEGDFLGLVDERVVTAGPSFQDVVRAVTRRLLAEPRDVITILTGENAPPLDGLLDELAEQHPGLEIDVHEGGQPHYPLLLSAE